ncbi:hypothetical protein CRUP_016358 [Coryphaenoides rupestris]|nr:hypothetical protein CRUP_016358 [Coryphaenoides rupestris]
MEHTGIEQVSPTHHVHEPISFGIDQILNSSGGDPGGPPQPGGGPGGPCGPCIMLPHRTAGGGEPESAWAAGAAGGPNVYATGGGCYSNVYGGSNPACSYNVNMNMNVSMNMNVNVNPAGGGGGGGGAAASGGGGGVIRVPAHRPMAMPAPPTPISHHHPPGMAPGMASPVPGIPGLPGMPGNANFTFPWMESSRRFAKDRLTDGYSGGPGANKYNKRNTTR